VAPSDIYAENESCLSIALPRRLSLSVYRWICFPGFYDPTTVPRPENDSFPSRPTIELC
jgi:hypothetical protein